MLLLEEHKWNVVFPIYHLGLAAPCSCGQTSSSSMVLYSMEQEPPQQSRLVVTTQSQKINKFLCWAFPYTWET